MRKVEKIYVYNNNRLYLILVNRYERIPLIIYEKEIDNFRIREIRKNSYLEGLRSKILQVEAEVNKKYSEVLKNALPKLILTTDFLEVRREQFEKTFDEKCEVNQEDIKRIINKGIKEIYLDEGYQVTECNIINYVFDNNVVSSLYGTKVENIKLIVDVLITDNVTINELQSLFSAINIVFDKKYLIDYRLLQRLKQENTAIIDLNYEINKVFVKDKNHLSINYLNTGIGTILNKLYAYFKAEYDEKQAEVLTRFIKNNWIFSMVDYEYDIIEKIDIKKVIEVTQEIFLQYFKLLFSKFSKIDKFYIVCDGMFEKELVKFLNLNFEHEIKQAFPQNLVISAIGDNKVGYCLNKIYEEEV